MAKIIGDPFDTPVHTQITVRQNSLAKRQKSDDDIKVFNTSTPWIRLSSSIEVSEERAKKLAVNLDIPEKDIVGSALAKKLVLFAGTTDGRGDVQRGGVGYGLDNAYGFLSDPGQGYRPMPGITSISTTYKNNGSLKQAQVNLKCYTRKQFEALEAIYLRLGYTMILEYGHSVYFDNQGSKQSMSSLAIPNMMFYQVNIDPQKEARAAAAQVVGDENAKDAAYYDALREAEAELKEQYGPSKIRKIFEKNKKETGGNYDALLAKVSNFSWSLGNDLSYDITLDLVSLGDIIDSLKMNLGGGIETAGSFEAITNKGIQNLVNIRLQRNTGHFITFLQELTELLETRDAIELVSEESQEKIKEINRAVTLSKRQAEYRQVYTTTIAQIRDGIIKPYDTVKTWLAEQKIKIRTNTLRDEVLLVESIPDNIQDAIETTGLTEILDTASDLNAFTLQGGIYSQANQTILEYYGLEYKKSGEVLEYRTTVTSLFGAQIPSTSPEWNAGTLSFKDTDTSQAYRKLNENLNAIESAVKEPVNTTSEEGEDSANNEDQVRAFSKYKDEPLTVIKYLTGASTGDIQGLEGLRNTLLNTTRRLEEYAFIIRKKLQ